MLGNRGLLALQLVTLCLVAINFDVTSGHGSLLDPVSRGSRWRYDSTAVPDYNDNEGFCGGLFVQVSNNGRCGLCGDNYADNTPRAHELHGRYGQGVIVKRYQSGSTLHVGVRLTANHKGAFNFDLCNLDGNSEREECFRSNPLQLVDGRNKLDITIDGPGWFNTTLNIPSNLRCQHCVFRWTYVGGNNWGICDDGSGQLGCGPQETFVGCSDIAIDSGRSAFDGQLFGFEDIPEEVSEE